MLLLDNFADTLQLNESFAIPEKNLSLERTKSFAAIYGVLRILGAASFLTTAISLARNKLLASMIGPGGFGSLALLQALISTAANLGGVGIGYSALRLISRARGRHRRSQSSFLERCFVDLGRSLAILTALGTATLLTIWNVTRSGDLRFFDILAIAAGSAFAILASIAVTRLQTRRVPRTLAKVSVLGALLFTALVLIAAGLEGERAVPLIAALLPITTWMVAVVAAGPVLSGSRGNSFRNEIAKKVMLRDGAGLMLPGVIDAVGTFSIRIVGVAILGLSPMGQIYAAITLSGFAYAIAVGAMNQDFLPRLSEASSNKGQLYMLASEQLLITIYVIAPVLLLLGTFSREATDLFFASSFVQTANILPIVAILIAVNILNWPIHSIQTATRQPLHQIAGSAVNILGSLGVIGLCAESLTATTFAFALLCGAALQFVTQCFFLRAATGITYSVRDFGLPIVLIITLSMLASATPESMQMSRIVACAIAATFFSLAVRHYLVYRK